MHLQEAQQGSAALREEYRHDDEAPVKDKADREYNSDDCHESLVHLTERIQLVTFWER